MYGLGPSPTPWGGALGHESQWEAGHCPVLLSPFQCPTGWVHLITGLNMSILGHLDIKEQISRKTLGYYSRMTLKCSHLNQYAITSQCPGQGSSSAQLGALALDLLEASSRSHPTGRPLQAQHQVVGRGGPHELSARGLLLVLVTWMFQHDGASHNRAAEQMRGLERGDQGEGRQSWRWCPIAFSASH